MQLRTRLLGLVAIVLVLLVGAIFNAFVAVVALVSALVLGALSWLVEYPRWLRPVWYAGLIIGAAAVNVSAPKAVVGGPISSCTEIPALRLSQGDSVMAAAESIATPPIQRSQDRQERHFNDGVISEAAYLVRVERDHVSYEERVDVHLDRGHFVNLDLSELGSMLTKVRASTEIMVGGDGMVAEMFTPHELGGTIGLSTRPRSVWIETRMVVPRGAIETCRGATLMPFQSVGLAWPQPEGTPISGLVQLPGSEQRIPFAARIEKQQAQLSAVSMPRNALFLQRPVLLKRTPVENSASTDRFAPVNAGVDVASFAMRPELLPDNRIVRSDWAYERRDWFFPPRWTLALLYVLLVSALADVFMTRRAPPHVD